jgi:hypothetical protein
MSRALDQGKRFLRLGFLGLGLFWITADDTLTRVLGAAEIVLVVDLYWTELMQLLKEKEQDLIALKLRLSDPE